MPESSSHRSAHRNLRPETSTLNLDDKGLPKNNVDFSLILPVPHNDWHSNELVVPACSADTLLNQQLSQCCHQSFTKLYSRQELSWYGPKGTELSDLPRERPLRVLFLTSIRDVGKSEGVGKTWPSKSGRSHYLKGTIEAALEASRGGSLQDEIEIAGIITDDMERDLRGSDFVAHPSQPGLWIFPRSLRDTQDELATSLVMNIPSDFRALPLTAREERTEAKMRFEKSVYDTMQAVGADVIISDHFLAKIDYLIDDAHFGLFGRVLNTHPGITRKDHPYRCLGVDTDILAWHHARGERLLDGGKIVSVKPHSKTGASFHVVSEKIDDGPVLCDGELTPIFCSDTPEEIGRRLYSTSKNLIFIEGVKHFARNIFPAVDESQP